MAKKKIQWTAYLPYVAWMQAIVATVGSLYFSEIVKLPPCTLCWYQRIFIYPLVILLPMGIWRKDKNIADFALALAIPGSLIAVFHNLLYYGIIPESAAPCALGVSCTTKFFEWFGFVTIPLLSLSAFLVIIATLWFWKKSKKQWI